MRRKQRLVARAYVREGGEGKGVKSTDIVTVAISNVRSHNNWFAVAKLEEAGCWLE
jgi:hypothetical protein